MNIIITPDASLDMENIRQYFTNELHSPQGAEKIIDSFLSSINLLSIFPYVGPKMSGFFEISSDFSEYRFWTVGNYKIFYRIESDTKLVVVRVLSTRQNYIAFFQ
jgi:addiction module RelE/StbE family toxin